TLYSGQIVRTQIGADKANTAEVLTRLYVGIYGQDDRVERVYGPEKMLKSGAMHLFEWLIPDTEGAPIFEIGLEMSATQITNGIIYLDYLTWDGTPEVVFRKPEGNGVMWRRTWVNGVDQYEWEWPEAVRIIQNRGRGLLITGTRDWINYKVQATLTPHLVNSFGLAACVQGQERYYALLLSDRNTVRLVKRLDGEVVLAEQAFVWEFGRPYQLQVALQDNQVLAWVDGSLLFKIDDIVHPLASGGIALVCEEGRLSTDNVSVLSTYK
ncbi:MAG: ADP-ribosylglycohydrolase family protein, partial [Chloroflexi bacterium]|nr:ADP-ribosylglycohydrolase family protein [Chloroflexota bacterium]